MYGPQLHSGLLLQPKLHNQFTGKVKFPSGSSKGQSYLPCQGSLLRNAMEMFA